MAHPPGGWKNTKDETMTDRRDEEKEGGHDHPEPRLLFV